ncbi:hypothetical protein Pint_32897 [Pistacia integerrima]|uniref:Uncharacterized protein n=1 Tax=Pistacia integerrima TaxID=434235 RepID=A0ACC0X2E5_9ROSI|nr:hypothetical protein Pint_32897 [Pistacia integerrima]
MQFFLLLKYLWQAALEKDKNLEATVDGETNQEEVELAENISHGLESAESLTSQMNELCVSTNEVLEIPPSDTKGASDAVALSQDIDKRIRALKKKVLLAILTAIRLAEAQQQKTGQREMKPEQLEKLSKLEGWREELKLLKDKKGEMVES